MSEPAAAGGRRSQIVIPEAVPLDLPLADLGTRAVAFLIDFALQVAVIVMFGFMAAMAGVDSGTVAGGVVPVWVVVVVVLLLNFAVWWGYPIACEALFGGRTLGKAAMGLRVVTVEGGPVGLRHATVRAVMGLIDFALLLGAGAVVSALVTSRSQRLGDLVAGTVVVRERTAAAAPRAQQFAVPAGYQGYAATIDPAGLRPADYHALRRFLMRAPDLDPQVRAEVADRLATPLQARVAHNRPAEVPPDVFLQCLAARHQERGRRSSG